MTMRVATYSRVSTDHHDQKPEVQVEELRRYCEARGWTIVEEIVDHGYTGKNDARPGLAKLMGMVKARKVDAVVVLKLDRLFRSLKHLIGSLDEMAAVGITFVATRDQIDYSTPGGRLFVQMLGALAEFERAILVERVRLGLEHARRKGKVLGRPRKSSDEAIRALRDQGMTYRAIQQKLSVAPSSVRRALANAASKTPTESTAPSAEIVDETAPTNRATKTDV